MFKFEMEEQPAPASHGIWAEKFRPTELNDFIGSDLIKNTLKSWIDTRDIPMMSLFHGSPGGGKTSIAKMLIKHIPCDYLFVNASDENDVNTMRNKVQEFAMTIGCNPIKIVVLDEFERLTLEAQSLLRGLSEMYYETTRFILTCNYTEKVLLAIKSRCQSFEIKPPSKSSVMSHIVGILNKEKILFDPKDVAWVINSYYPDMRKIINYCQQSSISGSLKLSISSHTDQDYKTKLVELLKTPDKAGVFTDIRQLLADAAFSNYDEIYKYLYSKIDDYAYAKIAGVILILAEYNYQSNMVVEKEITMCACIHKLLTVLNNK